MKLTHSLFSCFFWHEKSLLPLRRNSSSRNSAWKISALFSRNNYKRIFYSSWLSRDPTIAEDTSEHDKAETASKEIEHEVAKRLEQEECFKIMIRLCSQDWRSFVQGTAAKTELWVQTEYWNSSGKTAGKAARDWLGND